jgi:predicted nucleic acid-binding protein
MSIVVDASVCGAWLLPDEVDERADRVRNRYLGGILHVPSHWRVEIISLLLKAERRRRVQSASVDEAIMLLDAIPIAIDPTSRADQIIRMARRHELTPYDAAYLELAHHLGVPLATLDRKLAAAARKENLPEIA